MYPAVWVGSLMGGGICPLCFLCPLHTLTPGENAMKKIVTLAVSFALLFGLLVCFAGCNGNTTKKCQTCNGRAAVDCTNCKGKGTIKLNNGNSVLCSTCGGEKVRGCTSCKDTWSEEQKAADAARERRKEIAGEQSRKEAVEIIKGQYRNALSSPQPVPVRIVP